MNLSKKELYAYHGYAVTMEWKNISWQLESKIDEAFNNRGKSDLVRNSRKRRERNS